MCLSLIIYLYEYKLECMFLCRYCNCVYMSRRLWFCVYVFLYVCGVKCVHMSECVCIYMLASQTRERERERERAREREREREREGDNSLEGN